MKSISHHVHRVHQHLRCHHKKYLFGVFGSFAVVKLFVLVLSGLGTLPSLSATFADNQSGCVLMGQYYTGAYQEGCFLTGGYLTGGSEVCQEVSPGYRTGGSLDESGNMINQTYIDPVQSCSLTGQYSTGGYETGCSLTGGYWTGGTLQCPSFDSGSVSSGVQAPVSSPALSNGICGLGDISLSTPSSGSVVASLFPVQWQYTGTDCLSGTNRSLALQVLDYNGQWISFSGYTSLSSGVFLDTSLLAGIRSSSGVLLSGLYHVMGTGLSGEQIYVFTGMYTGLYTSFWTGYRMRLIDSLGQVLSLSDTFTIDARTPVLSGIQWSSSQSSSGYLPLGATLQLTFAASKELSGVDIRVGGFSGSLVQKSGLMYTYVWNLGTGYASGPLSYTLVYKDLTGISGLTLTGQTSYTYDKELPVLSTLGFSLSGTSLVLASLTLNEPVLVNIRYFLSGGQIALWSSTGYASTSMYAFSGLELGLSYTYRIRATDVAGNIASYEGSLWRSSTGIQFLQTVNTGINATVTGTLANLGLVLKNEIAKFTACKNSLSYTEIPLQISKNMYILHLPDFKKSYVKKVVDAFSLLVLNQVEKSRELSPTEINDITKKFDDFLVILKLMRDDDNACKQNLSNYHITQFKRMLSEYGLYLQ